MNSVEVRCKCLPTSMRKRASNAWFASAKSHLKFVIESNAESQNWVSRAHFRAKIGRNVGVNWGKYGRIVSFKEWQTKVEPSKICEIRWKTGRIVSVKFSSICRALIVVHKIGSTALLGRIFLAHKHTAYTEISENVYYELIFIESISKKSRHFGIIKYYHRCRSFGCEPSYLLKADGGSQMIFKCFELWPFFFFFGWCCCLSLSYKQLIHLHVNSNVMFIWNNLIESKSFLFIYYIKH